MEHYILRTERADADQVIYAVWDTLNNKLVARCFEKEAAIAIIKSFNNKDCKPPEWSHPGC